MKYTKFIGLDVHKDTIAVAVAKEGREAAETLGTTENKGEQGDGYLVLLPFLE